MKGMKRERMQRWGCKVTHGRLKSAQSNAGSRFRNLQVKDKVVEAFL